MGIYIAESHFGRTECIMAEENAEFSQNDDI